METPKKKNYKKRGFVFHNNNKYHKQTRLKEGWRVVCFRTHMGQHCTGRGYFADSGEFTQTEDEFHSSWCTPIVGVQQIEELKAKYRNAITHSIVKPRKVFDQLVREIRLNNENIPPLNYSNFRNITSYAKQKENPPQPKNLLELGQSLLKEEHKKMLRYNWTDSAHLQVEIVQIEDSDHNTSVSVIFGDKNWNDYVLSFIEHTVEGFSDGTFRIKPAKIKSMQLFKFEVSCFCRGVPLIYVLMERRTANDYEAVIRCITEKFIPQLLNLRLKVHTDFEAAETKGWKLVIPSSEFAYCLFHFDNIQWKNAKRLGALQTDKTLRKKNLSELEKVKKEEENKILEEIEDTLKLIFAMPLLPLEMKADKALVTRIMERLSEKAKTKMNRYFIYLDDNWISSKHPPETWNVSKQAYKTNNFAESGNREMNSFFSQAHPEPWMFIRTLVSYHDRITSEFHATVGKIDLKKDKLIEEYRQSLLAGKMQRIEFLFQVAKMSHEHHDKKFKEQVNQAANEDDEENDHEQEEETVNAEKEDNEMENDHVTEEISEYDFLIQNEDQQRFSNKSQEDIKQSGTSKDAKNSASVTTDIEKVTDKFNKHTKSTKKRSRKKTIGIKNRKGGDIELEAFTPPIPTLEQKRKESKTNEQFENSGPNETNEAELNENTKSTRKHDRKQTLSIINREGGDLEIEDSYSPILAPKKKKTKKMKNLRV